MVIGENLLMETWVCFYTATVASNKTHLLYSASPRQAETDSSMISRTCRLSKKTSKVRQGVDVDLSGRSSEIGQEPPNLRATCGSARQTFFQTSTAVKKNLIGNQNKSLVTPSNTPAKG